MLLPTASLCLRHTCAGRPGGLHARLPGRGFSCSRATTHPLVLSRHICKSVAKAGSAWCLILSGSGKSVQGSNCPRCPQSPGARSRGGERPTRTVLGEGLGPLHPALVPFRSKVKNECRDSLQGSEGVGGTWPWCVLLGSWWWLGTAAAQDKLRQCRAAVSVSMSLGLSQLDGCLASAS